MNTLRSNLLLPSSEQKFSTQKMKTERYAEKLALIYKTTDGRPRDDPPEGGRLQRGAGSFDYRGNQRIAIGGNDRLLRIHKD